jgi:hypothetical protein
MKDGNATRGIPAVPKAKRNWSITPPSDIFCGCIRSQLTALTVS